MPTYEMPILLRMMTKNDVRSTLRRISDKIFNTGGVIRKVENLGERDLPYKMYSHDQTHKRASFFVFYFDVPPKYIVDIKEEYARDIDVVKTVIFKIQPKISKPCTLDDELKPPAYRPDVQQLLEIARNTESWKNRHQFKYNSGLDYYPFQK